MDQLDHKQKPRPFNITFITAGAILGPSATNTPVVLSKHNKLLCPSLHGVRGDSFG